ncbi:MAG: DUF4240 domain-containing protein [Leptolyngbya sp. BL-A-14]
MTEDQFWELIARSREHGSDSADQAVKLASLLSSLPPREILAFEHLFFAKRAESYRWDLWGVVTLVQGGFCSDDSFEDFRLWLICQGRQAYENALANPETVLDLFDRESVARKHSYVPSFMSYECLGAVAYEAYESVTGKPLSIMDTLVGKTWPTQPQGEPWQMKDLMSMFPSVARRYYA